eukprot:SAG31_NODE_9299_length_1302_cov_1.406484_2_plen_163_part_00
MLASLQEELSEAVHSHNHFIEARLGVQELDEQQRTASGAALLQADDTLEKLESLEHEMLADEEWASDHSETAQYNVAIVTDDPGAAVAGSAPLIASEGAAAHASDTEQETAAVAAAEMLEAASTHSEQPGIAIGQWSTTEGNSQVYAYLIYSDDPLPFSMRI